MKAELAMATGGVVVLATRTFDESCGAILLLTLLLLLLFLFYKSSSLVGAVGGVFRTSRVMYFSVTVIVVPPARATKPGFGCVRLSFSARSQWLYSARRVHLSQRRDVESLQNGPRRTAALLRYLVCSFDNGSFYCFVIFT